ncbi:MAG TPA: hypothetical protein VMB48_07565 [Steroidobacteraceae bacterium]|nr:hypothetical protein [Steroidobacteraceae bacterium]
MDDLGRNFARAAALAVLLGAGTALADSGGGSGAAGAQAWPTGAAAAQLGKPYGPQGDTWASIAKLPDWSGIWQLDWEHSRGGLAAMRPSPPKLLPAAQAKLTAYRAGQKEGEDLQPQSANCLPPGMPQIMTQPYPLEFLFSPGKVVILIEAYMQERHVFTDGRGHPSPDDLNPGFQGNSIGHWEGDTLVIDTVGFVPFTQIAAGVGHSDEMRIVERIRKTDADHMLIQTTIIDPKVLAAPWTTVHPYVRDKGELMEYECEQNNRDSADPEGRPGERIGADAAH